MTKHRLLVIDDDPGILRFLKAAIPDDQFEVETAVQGRDGIAQIANTRPDVVLLDLGLPDLDGIKVVREVRAWSAVPIIVVSARHEDGDKVSALDAGADDYMTKPFSVPELMARVRVAIRRLTAPRDEAPPTFEAKGVRVDLSSRRVWKGETEVHLSQKEYNLLTILIRFAGKTVTHRQLLLLVWGDEHQNEVQYLRVCARRLREKLEEAPARPQFLLTEPNVGYRVATDSD